MLRKRKRIGKSGKRAVNKSGHPALVKITSNVRAVLKAHVQRTGIGAMKLMRKSDDLPSGLKPGTIQNWLAGYSKTARKDYLEFVLKAWEKLPDQEYIKITPAHRSELKEYIQSTGVKQHTLLRNKRSRMPEGLNSPIIAGWISGEVKSARKDHLDFVLQEWKALSASQAGRINITPEIIKALRYERDRTRISAQMLVKKYKDIPAGLTAAMINALLSGKVKTMRQDYLNYLLAQWKNLPDSRLKRAIGKRSPRLHSMSDFLAVTPDMRKSLCEYRDHTGVGAHKLLKGICDVPEGLTSSTVNNWLNGRVVTANREYYEYVLNRWKLLKYGEDSSVIISEKIFEKLDHYRGLGFLPGEIFRISFDDPEDLTSNMVSAWLLKTTTRARKEHIEFVFKKCKELENAPDKRIQITQDMHSALLVCRNVSEIGPKLLFDGLSDIPAGLSYGMVAGWLSKTITTARKDHWSFVLENWSRISLNGSAAV